MMPFFTHLNALVSSVIWDNNYWHKEDSYASIQQLIRAIGTHTATTQPSEDLTTSWAKAVLSTAHNMLGSHMPRASISMQCGNP